MQLIRKTVMSCNRAVIRILLKLEDKYFCRIDWQHSNGFACENCEGMQLEYTTCHENITQ